MHTLTHSHTHRCKFPCRALRANPEVVFVHSMCVRAPEWSRRRSANNFITHTALHSSRTHTHSPDRAYRCKEHRKLYIDRCAPSTSILSSFCRRLAKDIYASNRAREHSCCVRSRRLISSPQPSVLSIFHQITCVRARITCAKSMECVFDYIHSTMHNSQRRRHGARTKNTTFTIKWSHCKSFNYARWLGENVCDGY